MNNTANNPQAAEKNRERNLRNKQLAILAQKGSEKAMRKLLEENEEFYYKIAHVVLREKNAPAYILEYLMDEVPESLFHAVRRYKPETGNEFLTFAGDILKKQMKKKVKFFYRPNEVSLSAFEKKVNDPYDEDVVEYEISIGNVVEPWVVKKVYFEQFRDFFLELTPRQKMILEYKFGYDPSRPVLTCEGRELLDEVTAEFFNSKTSLIKRNIEESYSYLRQKLSV